MALDMEELARQNRGLIYQIALSFRWACDLDRATDLDDLMQAGALGVWTAARSFDPEGGKSWASYAAWFIKREMRAALGIASTRRRADIGAVSMSSPVSMGDTNGLTIEETIADETLPEIDAGVLTWDEQRQVHDAVARLKDDRQRDAITAKYFAGQSQGEIGAAMGISAQRVSDIIRAGFRKLRQDRRLQEISEIEMRMPYYKKIGVEGFNTTMTSAVEYAALWREDQLERRRKNEIQTESKGNAGCDENPEHLQ